MIYMLYIIYFLYPIWFLGQMSTDDGVIFGILFMLHSAYAFLFTVIAVFLGDMFSFVINLILLFVSVWVYNSFLL